jgi:hypothetical protein
MAGEQQGDLVSRLRAVIEAKDEQIAALTAGLRSPAIGYPQLCDVRLCPRWLVRNYQILVDSGHVSGACGDPGGHAGAM